MKRSTSRVGVRTAILLLVAVTGLGGTARGADDTVPKGFRAIALQHLGASEFAKEARGLLTQSKHQADVLVDSELNRVLVRGSDEAQRFVVDLAQTLDRPAESAPPVKVEAEVVRGYRTPPEELDGLLAKLQKKFPASTKARIVADRRTNQIVVVAPLTLQSQVDQFIRQNSSTRTPATGDGRSEVRNQPAASNAGPGGYALQNLTWRELEDALRSVWGNALSVSVSRNGELATLKMPNVFGERELLQVDRRNDQVLVPGDDGITQVWQRLIRSIDAGSRLPDHTTRLTTIRKANPDQVNQAVRLLNTVSQQARQEDGAVRAVRVENGRRVPNNLVSMIFQPGGQPPANEPARGTEPARPAAPPANQPNAEDVPANPEGLLEDGGLLGDVQLEFVPEMGIIVVKGHRRDVEKVMKIIQEIEKQSQQTQPKFEVVQLKNANSNAMAEMLIEIYRVIFEPRQGAVSITGLGKPNAILLIGRAEAIDVVKDLIEKLDQPVDEVTQFEVFHLKYADATQVQTAIDTFFRQRTGLGARVTVVAETRSNSLIVQSAPRDMAEVRGIISKIDVPGGIGRAQEVRIFRLKNALAQDLATILQDAISGTTTRTAGQAQVPGQPAAGGAGAAQARQTLELILVDPEAGKIFRSGILSDVRVRADTNGNALIVTAPPESMDLVGSLIEKLDQLPGGEAQIKVFTVENGDATSLMATLQQVFGQQVTAGQGAGGLFGGGFNAAQFGLGTAGGGAEGSLVPLRFAVDVRTNSIIVSGSSSDLKVVEVLLLRLDEGEIATRRIRVFRLKNAFATDVYNSLQTFLTSQRSILQLGIIGNQSLITPYEQLETQVAISAEAASNSVIVSATPRYFEQIQKVIEQLDYRPPMVLVQVLIAEVRLNDLYEFGVELGLQDSLLYDRGKASLSGAGYDSAANPGFNFNNAGLPNANNRFQGSLAGQSLSSFGLGRSNTALGYGGLVLSAASESINILLRAMEDTGRVQVLSRPQVMAIHNRQASVLVGEKVPRITGSTTNQQGNVTNNVVDTNVGLILNIIPQINDDGIVILNVQAERSSLGPESQGIQIGTTPQGAPIRQPIIKNTSAITTISARSGQTVVFAGLISDEKTVAIRRVPYLSDIPVIGKLFEFTSDNQDRRELMIIMTPHIVTDDADYDWVKAIESDRMSWCLGDVVALHGDVGLRGDNCLFCTNKLPVIYPDAMPLGVGEMPPSSVIEERKYIPAAPQSNRRVVVPQPVVETGEGQPAAPVYFDPADGASATWQAPAGPAVYGPMPYYGPAPQLAAPASNPDELQPPPPVRLSRLPRPQPREIAPTNYATPSAADARTAAPR